MSPRLWTKAEVEALWCPKCHAQNRPGLRVQYVEVTEDGKDLFCSICGKSCPAPHV